MTNDAPAQASVEATARIICDTVFGVGHAEGSYFYDECKHAAEKLAALSPPPTVGAEDEASCDEMLAEAERLAAQIGYMVVPDPYHADGEIHAPDFVVQVRPSLLALGFDAVPLNHPALEGWKARLADANQKPNQ